MAWIETHPDAKLLHGTNVEESLEEYLRCSNSYLFSCRYNIILDLVLVKRNAYCFNRMPA